MRQALLSLLLLSALAANAQPPGNHLFTRPGVTEYRLSLPPKNLSQEQLRHFFQNQNDSLMEVLGLKDQSAHNLPQDRIPCIVPDTSAVKMPNAFPNPQVPFASRMPNPAQIKNGLARN
jgi:hypothetical protein